tara:strand:+ start:124 stop:447 length:324 start_codon:yes stop_codon:yes gene_type:complete
MNITKVLNTFYKEHEWVAVNNDYDSLYWAEGNSIPKPTLEELQSKWDNQIAEINNRDIQALRQQEIIASWPIEKQFEAITEYHMDRPEKLDELIAYIQAVKDKYPKN